MKSDPAYWYLSVSLLILAFEGLFTLTIKANQEWRWYVTPISSISHFEQECTNSSFLITSKDRKERKKEEWSDKRAHPTKS